jgi:hypothetical protein
VFLAVIMLGVFSAYDVEANEWLVWTMCIVVFGPLYYARYKMDRRDHRDLIELQKQLDTDPTMHTRQKRHILSMFTNPIVISGIIVFLIAGYFVFSS